MDPGDGVRGFVRVLFGYIDRIERSTITDDNGATQTIFNVQGSDFQKAVDKTDIYFNSYMRTILDEKFARSDEGAIRPSFSNDADGSALRNAGLTAFGSPADYVENFLQVLLGFGQQWKLPRSYPANEQRVKNNRQRRVQRTVARINPASSALIQTLGFAESTLKTSIDKVIDIAREITKTPAEENISANDARKTAAETLLRSSVLETARAQLIAAEASSDVGIQDLLSLDFIESQAIDGFNLNSAIWQAQGALSQFLYGNSNGFVNELIFDLRPVSISPSGQEGGLLPGEYSTEADELKINVGGAGEFDHTVAAVRYEPAVIFREYPYSIVDKFNLDGLHILPTNIPIADAISGGAVDPEASIELRGDVLLGPIFTQGVNISGRHTYTYPATISSVDCALFKDQKAVKHIDSITIQSTDVKDSKVGRSDDDIFNLFQITTHDPNIHQQYKSTLSNFSPLVNQASVARDGLRVMEIATQFANFGDGSQCRVGGSPDSNAVRRNLVRWQLLLDHWYQHNSEYLSGSLVLRSMPELRVGYRLDWEDMCESYYVEEVRHEWKFPGAAKTIVGVSRGQRNDPFPVYVPPVFLNAQNDVITQSSGDRSFGGRLGKFFEIKDTQASAHWVENPGPIWLGRNAVDEKDNIPKTGTLVFPGTTKYVFGEQEVFPPDPSDDEKVT